MRALTLTGMDQHDYLAQANAETVIFAMIETREAIENLDAILATEGIDGVFVGPSDLSINLSGGKTLDPQSKEIDALVTKIGEAAKRAGKIAGAYTGGAERANELAGRGFRYLAVASDVGFLRAGTASALKALKR